MECQQLDPHMKGPPHQLKKIISLNSVVVLFVHIPSTSEAVSSRGHTVHESITTKPNHQSEELSKNENDTY